MILGIDHELRICPKCKEQKAVECFDNKNSSINGRSKWCLQCKKQYSKEYKENNKEKIRQSYLLRKEQYNNAKKEVYHNDEAESREKLRQWYRHNTCGRLWHSAKRRAKVHGLDFNIEKEDIIIPDTCPVLGIKLVVGNGNAHDSSPSLDRIIPEKGYVKGNVIVVSHKANTIKSNATIQELEKVFEFYNKIIGVDENCASLE